MLAVVEASTYRECGGATHDRWRYAEQASIQLCRHVQRFGVQRDSRLFVLFEEVHRARVGEHHSRGDLLSYRCATVAGQLQVRRKIRCISLRPETIDLCSLIQQGAEIQPMHGTRSTQAGLVDWLPSIGA